MKPTLTVIFLTLNEEFHIGEAIDNVKDIADEIFVLDSLSVDRTVDIALEKGAKVYQRRFTGFGEQWNAALTKLPIKTDWTMKMDPDERLPDDLKREIVDAIANPGDCAAFNMVPSLYFMNKPLRLEMIPVTRLWKTGKGMFSKISVNEHLVVDGKIGTLKKRFQHLDCRDLHQWVDKQNRYTSAEAIRVFRGEEQPNKPNLFGSFLERRMWIKEFYQKLPFHLTLRFLHYYIWKGMWMRGRLGLAYSIMRIWCCRIVELKINEMRATGRVIIVQPNRKNEFDPRCVIIEC